jgi:Thrombospondin type 3 repeat
VRTRVGVRDGDGVVDGSDNCPDVRNPTQHDEDADAYGDVCDLCPHIGDPMQPDADGDAVGDACDPDPLARNAIVEFLPFEGAGVPDGWNAEVEAGDDWAVVGGDLVVSVADDDVGRFTRRLVVTPGLRIETAFTVVSLAPFMAGFPYRSIGIATESGGPIGADDTFFAGLTQEVGTPAAAALEALLLRSGASMTALATRSLGEPVALGERYRLSCAHGGADRVIDVSGPRVASIAANTPLTSGEVGVRVRGMQVRVHYLVMIQ